MCVCVLVCVCVPVTDAVSILRGLRHIHAMDVCHRDLKPANLFLSRYMPYMGSLYVCFICMLYMYALYVCHRDLKPANLFLSRYMPYMGSLYVCFICMLYMYALYVCFICLLYMYVTVTSNPPICFFQGA